MVVEAEDTGGDDGSEVEAAAETSAARSETTSVETPGTEDHHGRVKSQQAHRDAAKRVDD